VKDINPEEHFFIHCAGYRSMMAASILQARGYRNFSEIEGGYNAIAKQLFLKPILCVKVKFKSII
jgi:rhodanese-related sulfurtransferase